MFELCLNLETGGEGEEEGGGLQKKLVFFFSFYSERTEGLKILGQDLWPLKCSQVFF